ncbi:hypothetical protein VTK73DRAFT_437 [Phialemonium thermophilum]|uniref:Intradiol ring-cleavage dioxygenases domain-containing protein n=1 Tax=Phialemonium thermophilum TaxID=223376 RepID=A0ABR3XFF5_9PEZI
MGFKSSLAALLLAVPWTLGHPGEKVPLHAATLPRSLNHCKKRFSEPEFVRKTVEIHGREFSKVRRAFGFEQEHEPMIHKRDYISVNRIDHKSNKTVSWTTDPATLFTDAGACMLTPAVDQGPLYVKGEDVRRNITEGQAGIRMTFVIQVVDYHTCNPVPNAYLDVWSSNATGMYVGVQGYPGMGDPNDASILKGTTLRGVQPTDDHGIAVFDSLIPGHYTGRATHIHTITWLGATKQPNNTITGGNAAHVGQLFFDQPMLTQANTLHPYVTNKQTVTQNVADYYFMAMSNGGDPVLRYSLVGDKLEDGIFAWIRYGIDTTAKKNVDPAAFWTANGGVMNPTGPISQITGGGIFGGGGFGGFPGFGGGGAGGGGGGGFGGFGGGGFGGFGRKKRAAQKKAD